MRYDEVKVLFAADWGAETDGGLTCWEVVLFTNSNSR